jgi:hypothetical protein
MGNSKAFPKFTTIFLIVVSTLFQFTTEAGDNENSSLQPSTPQKTSKILHLQADRHELLAKHHAFAEEVDGISHNKPWHKFYAEENFRKAHDSRKRARKVERVEKQLDTDTVAGKATPPIARNRIVVLLSEVEFKES